MKGTQQALSRRLFDELITATHPRLTPSSRVRRFLVGQCQTTRATQTLSPNPAQWICRSQVPYASSTCQAKPFLGMIDPVMLTRKNLSDLTNSSPHSTCSVLLRIYRLESYYNGSYSGWKSLGPTILLPIQGEFQDCHVRQSEATHSSQL